MPTSTGSSPFRFLLSLVIRLRLNLSVGRIALAFQARLASLWRSILAFARRRGQSRIRLRASDVPVVDNPMGERPQISEPASVEEEGSGTLAALPVRSIAHWQDQLSRYQVLTSSYRTNSDLCPATPAGGSQRYKPRMMRQKVEPPDIPAGQRTLLSALPRIPDGWTRHVHPEGNVFFYHEGLRIFTESNIIQCGTEILFYATTLIRQAMRNDDVILDELTEIVLNVDDDRHWHYYFVDHRNRLLFWVHPVKVREGLDIDLQGISGYSHIRYLVEARYWYASSGRFSVYLYDKESRSHCEYYPQNRVLPQGVFEELRGMLNYTKTDMMTAVSSTSPFTQQELVMILDIVNSLKDDEKISDPHSIWIIVRLMAFFTEDKFMNFCGQPCARPNADTPLFEQHAWNRSIVFKVASVFLFWSLNEHAVRLQRVWVDGIIIQPRWKDFVNRLTAELGRYTIFSTVMLAVNFSFLAVPGVVSPGAPASQTEIIIYCSIASTIGSIVFSLALLNMYSDPRPMDADFAAEVMKVLSQKRWGMARFAITHCLPHACLIWSIILFATALAVQIFGPKERPTVVTLGVECLVLVLFGFVSMRVMWLFFGDNSVDGVVASAEDNPPPEHTGPQDDIELGSME